MSARSEAVMEQIRSAMQSTNSHDIITGVKEAVTREVTALSPDANIVVTNYFNHTYMPDLVLEWHDAGGREARPIFLRNTFRSNVTEHEVAALAQQAPVVLSLAAFAEPAGELDLLRERAQQATRVLVTDVASLADVATPGHVSPQDRVGNSGAPLLRLVQANLLKGGRGLLTAGDAQRLTQSAAPSDDNSLTEEFLNSFQQSADEMFTPDAALRLRRSAELLRFGLSREVVETLSLTGGQLSDVELRVLLPYLLSDETAVANPRLWTYIGSMMSLERLEEMEDALANVDVSPLVVPNMHTWLARRAQLVLNATFDDPAESHTQTAEDELLDDEIISIGMPVLPAWFVRNRTLTAEVARWRLFVSTDARRLKGRTDSAPANWDDLSGQLAGFALDAVDLRGVSRRIFVGAQGSADVSADVSLIRAIIEDSFQVTEVRVRRIGEETDASIHVDFTEMTATAKHKAPVASLVRAAQLLGHRSGANFTSLIAAPVVPPLPRLVESVDEGLAEPEA